MTAKITNCNGCPCFTGMKEHVYGELCHFVGCSHNMQHANIRVDKDFDPATQRPEQCPLPTRCRPTRFYVASSWRNGRQPEVVKALRQAGHEVYDFREPEPGEHGFSWSEIDPDWQNWIPEQFCEALGHEIAQRGFDNDLAGMERADAFVLVMPCGRSAHLEAGWATGRGLPVAILLDGQSEPELMYKLAECVIVNMDELLEWAGAV